MRRRRPPGGCRVGAEDWVDAEAAAVKMRLRSQELRILQQQLTSTGQGVRFVFRADRQIAEHRGRIGKEQPTVAAPKGYRQQ